MWRTSLNRKINPHNNPYPGYSNTYHLQTQNIFIYFVKQSTFFYMTLNKKYLLKNTASNVYRQIIQH